MTEFGQNTPSSPPSYIASQIFGYFFVGFGSILSIGSILVFLAWKPLGRPPAKSNLALAIVLAVVFFVQGAFNAWQDFCSSRVMKSITGMLPEDCLILRDGTKSTIPAVEVVPGDILCFQAGSLLPADIRFAEVSSDAKFDRSTLTGESRPVSALLTSEDENYLETKCIGMQGTHCISGTGVGVVVVCCSYLQRLTLAYWSFQSTGDRTVFGRIAKLTDQPSTGMTTLQKEILRFVVIIISLMIAMNLIVTIIWTSYIHKKHPDYISIEGR